MKVVIIDYGMGNIKSIMGALRYLDVTNIVVSNKENDIANADKLILPGVGSFNLAMKNIKDLSLDKFLKSIVLEEKKPILGICLGMQLMGNSSTEDGYSSGLGFVNTPVTRFDLINLRIPHVGLNQILISRDSRLYKNIKDGADFYFTHSYKMNDNDSINPSYCIYGEKFVASFELNNIAGVQFHPELSQTNGLQLLKNFIENF